MFCFDEFGSTRIPPLEKTPFLSIPFTPSIFEPYNVPLRVKASSLKRPVLRKGQKAYVLSVSLRVTFGSF